MRISFFCALLVAGCGGAAPSRAPLSPKQDPPPVDRTSDDELSKLSAEYRDEIERRGWSVTDERLDRIGAKVRAVCDSPFRPVAFRALRRPAPNALSLPTEYVYFTTGLLDALEKDAHVAFMVGHELAHMCLRHHANYLKASELAGRLDANEPRSRDELWEYRRQDELEADRFGLLYAVRAGYALDEVIGTLPSLAVHFRELEADASKASGSHPPFAERIKAVNAFREKLVEAHGLFEQAGRAYRGLHYERAIDLYGRFLSTFPNSAAAHANVATARLQQIAARFEPLTDDLADELVFVEKCDVTLRDPVRSRMELAREDYRRCLAINPRFVAATLNLASLEVRLGNPGTAGDLLRSAERDAAGDAYATAVMRVHEGNVAYLAGRSAEALARYEDALKHRSSMTAAAFNRAVALAKLGRTDEAVAALLEVARHPAYHDRARKRLLALKPDAKVPAAETPGVEDELAGVKVGLLGTEPGKIQDVLGQPDAQPRDGDEETWEYGRLGLEVVLALDPRDRKPLRAKRVRVLEPGRYKTAQGVSLGDEASSVERLYGKPAGEVDPLHGQWRYANGLSFSIRDGRVREIVLVAR